MEIASRAQDRENSSPVNSPHSNGTSSSNNGGLIHQVHTAKPAMPSRSETSNNPYPTTFVQADTATFKHVVQMLTGSPPSSKPPSADPPPPSRGAGNIPPIKSTAQKKQGFKLYERRSSLKNGLMISPLIPALAQNSGSMSAFSPGRKLEILSPSILDFPSLVLSPVTPLIEDPFDKSSSPSVGSSSEEEKAIAEKGFYLHPSPRPTPRESEPQLLPLFPVTSPRVADASS
ncbi:VQ motif-containing protein 4-like [Diospyros lotus]|uniref:VQ motif-containing protein 4-like n=1 Tax=Diospyros lotus TaxID=55363 RepID=UPI002250D5EA|nr:VQ motif-containing protein 4-like [Diospyros lotus]